MGRLDVPDKNRDFVSVTIAYLDELYDEIEGLKKREDEMRTQLGVLLEQLAAARLNNRQRPPVYRLKKDLPW